MNRLCYRLVFNKTRGMLMAVGEKAASQPCAPSQAGPCAAWMPMAFMLLVVGAMPAAQAGSFSEMVIRADPSAPPAQRPTVIFAPNGVPLVNIQTPSSAGVSRNAYSSFDVGPQGAILNNSVTDTQTQLGGWVQGNPWLARGSARIILNEVNSSNPSLLYGHTEVAGRAATVIIANPSGITCNGCGFINAPRVTLTTGTAIIDPADGSVRGYRVQGGQVLIDGAGMNATQVSFTDIITRALKVNAGIWARDVAVIAGAGEVALDGETPRPATPLEDKDKPQVAIDLSALGGVYADRIRMIGTQSGVGVRNAGSLMAGVGEVVLTTDGKIINSGLIASADQLTLQAGMLDNQKEGHIEAASVQMQVKDEALNRGLIDGQQVRVQAGTLNNLGTGRLYGDQLAIAADTVKNLAEQDSAPVIAARERLDMAAGQINNREHALIFSGGDMAIGGAELNNASATIEALGELDLNVDRIRNTNEHFSTETVSLPSESIVEYQGSGSPYRYRPGTPDVYVYNDESDHLHTPEGNFESWSLYRYTREVTEERVASSDPGKIVSGRDMRIRARQVFNDRSHIVAGGSLDVEADTLTNTEVPGERRITDVGSVTNYWRDHEKGRDSTGSNYLAYAPPEAIERITLTPTLFRQNTQAVGNGSAPVNQQLPDSALYKFNSNPSAHYLVETDPRFASYREWLNSDYLLRGMSVDPNVTQKRLGDGYYEQRLIREQVAQLTGRRFLADHSNDEEQYLALMDQGITFAKAHQLVPGVALTAEQMAQLTSDIVWLVERDVTLPDGSRTKALVPQVYVRVQPGDLQPGGALMAGEQTRIDLTGDLVNGGTIAGRKLVALTAENVRNLGGRIEGDAVGLGARQDIDNIGGTVSAKSELLLSADRDINVRSETRTQSNAQGSITNVERVAGLYVTGDSGKLSMVAGRDVNLTAAVVANAGDSSTIAAVRDIKLGSVTQAESHDIAWDANNRRSDATQSEVGSLIQGRGAVQLLAGRDIDARAAEVQSTDGALSLMAGNDVRISAGETRRQVDEAHEHKGTSGWLSSTTYKTRDTLDERTAQSSNLSGKTVSISAGRDIAISGSNVASDTGTALVAQNDVAITAAVETRNETHMREEKTTGVFSSGGVGFTVGSQKQSTNSHTHGTAAAASTVGSVQGDVKVAATQSYRQTGSDVLAPAGNVEISARDVRIDEARETSRTTVENKFEQTGVTLAVSSPVITAIQTVDQMKQAAGNTSDSRMKVLAAANAGFAVNNAVNRIKDGQLPKLDTTQAGPNGEPVMREPNAAEKVGGIDISISLGSSRSESNTEMVSDSSRGSRVIAGGDVQIKAVGDGEASNLTVQGSDIIAGGKARLEADNAVQLLAARNTASQTTRGKDSSASVGISIGTSGLRATASFGAGKSKGDGSDVNYTNAHVVAGQNVEIRSEGDTTLRGAVVAAPQVSADVGGRLQIESLQDRSTYNSSQQSIGASISVGVGSISGSLSASQGKVNSNYASVAEQSGIKAGDGGFNVQVGKDAVLTGGAITSTQKAVEEDKNRYQAQGGTTLSDIDNHASYSASSTGINIGTAQDPAGKLAPSGTSVGIGSDGNQAQSVTHAAVSGIAGNKDARTGDAEAALPRIFDAERVQKEVNAQVQITQTFGREGSAAVGRYAADQLIQAQDKQRQAQQKQAQAEAAQAQGDTARATALTQEARALQQGADDLREMWGEQGAARVAMHAVVGGLTGGIDGAIGASTATVAAPLIDAQIEQLDLPDPVKKAVLAASTATLGAALGGTAGAGAAMTETVNNYLTSKQEIERDKELAACKNLTCTAATNLKYSLINAKQNAGLLVGVGGGIGLQGAEPVLALVDMVSNLPETLTALTAIVNDPQVLEKAGETVIADYRQRLDTLNRAYSEGTFDGSVTAGVEAGRLAVDIVGLGMAAIGAAKVVAITAKVGAGLVAGDAAKAAAATAKGAKGGAPVDILGGTRFGPANQGPLPEKVASTFRGGSYTQTTLQESITLYRVSGGNAAELGQYWTTVRPSGPLQAQIDLALKPEWGNTAMQITTIKVPAGQTIYHGAAASQGGAQVGGGSQVFIQRVDPTWLVR